MFQDQELMKTLEEAAKNTPVVVLVPFILHQVI